MFKLWRSKFINTIKKFTAFKDNHDAAMIFSLLLIVFLLTFKGRFTSIDELNLYSMAESFVQTGSQDVPQIKFAAYHNHVGEHEIGYSLLATILYWLAQRSSILNNIYTVMLLNPILVSITATLLFLCAKELGYSSSAATIAALAYGVGSLGWPYALSLYREPLVGFLWLLGLYGLIIWRQSEKNYWLVGLSTLAICLSVLVKINVIFSIPFLFWVLLGKRKKTRTKTIIVIWVIISICLLISFPLLYRWRTGNDFSFSIISFTNFDRFLRRVYGQLASPIKGLVFYMPISLLLIPSLYLFWREYSYLAAAITGSFLALLGATSCYSSWYGGESWGPRLLVPILPVLLIPLASLWDHVKRWSGRAVILSLLSISIIVQSAYATNNWWKGYAPFFAMSSQPENDVGLSFRQIDLAPPLVLLKEWRLNELDLLWLWVDEAGAWHTQIWVGISLIFCLFSVILIWKRQIARRFNSLIMFPLIPATLVVMLAGARSTFDYPGLTNETARDITTWVQPKQQRPYTLVTMSNEFHIYFLEGLLKGDFIHYWYSPQQLTAFDDILENSKGEELSLLADYVHIQPEYSGQELEVWLNTQFYRFDSQWFEGYKLVRYGISRVENWYWQPIERKFGPLHFSKFALGSTDVLPGDILNVQLRICKSAEITANYSVFLHLLSSETLLPGLDGVVRYDNSLPTHWEMGECLIEKRGIYIPQDTMPDEYDLVMGVNTPEGKIIVTDDEGNDLEYLTLVPIQVNAVKE